MAWAGHDGDNREIKLLYPRSLLSHPYPTQPLHFKEVKHYLKVFDLWNQKNPKMKWEDIFDKFHPTIGKELLNPSLSENQFDDLEKKKDSLMRQLKRDCECAKKIIKNTERGVFPGKY